MHKDRKRTRRYRAPELKKQRRLTRVTRGEVSIITDGKRPG